MNIQYTMAAVSAAMIFFTAQPADAAPAVDALQATKIATDYLAKRGAGAPHIVSVTLERSALVKGTESWTVRWSEAIASDGEKEVGLRVKLDGSTARLMETKGGGRKKQGVTPGFR